MEINFYHSKYKYWLEQVDLFPYNVFCLFVSISQVIGCEDRLRNDLLCVGWGVKLYSLTLEEVLLFLADHVFTLKHSCSAYYHIFYCGWQTLWSRHHQNILLSVISDHEDITSSVKATWNWPAASVSTHMIAQTTNQFTGLEIRCSQMKIRYTVHKVYVLTDW